MTVSAIYVGTLRHRRFAGRSHEFRRRLALAYIDLDELSVLLGGRLLERRPGLARFRRRDYLGDACIPLSDAVRDTVEARTGVRPAGSVRLLANLSAFGHCFNPVSFYYCMDRGGKQAEAVVAEVTNTPWGERHCYVVRPDSNQSATPAVAARSTHGRVLEGSFAKALHVSPFMGLDHRYELRLTVPAKTLSVHISSSREGKLAFDATLALGRNELTDRSLVVLAGTTLRTLAAIYTQAALLKFKGVPVYAHSGADVA
jgi:uncharacterized protein